MDLISMEGATTIIDYFLNNVGISVATAIILFLTYQIIKNYRLQKLFQNHSIPGPKPTLFFGNMLELGADGRVPHETVTMWMRQYGNVFGFFIGHDACLIINDIDMAKEIAITRFSDFVNRRDFANPFNEGLENLTDYQGEKWRNYRAILNTVFSGSKLKLYFENMNDKCDILVNKLREHAGGKDFNVGVCLEALVLDVITISVLGLDVDSQRNSEHPMLKMIRNFFNCPYNIFILLGKSIPFMLPLMDVINKLNIFGDTVRTLIDNVKELVNKRFKDPKKSHTNMIEILLNGRESNTTNNKSMSEMDIIANGILFLLAGYETTEATLGYAIYLLALNQDVQDKLYREILTNLKDDDGPLTQEQIRVLTYVDQVLNETLRMYPVAPLVTTRSSKKDRIVGDVFIPKGVTVMFPAWDIHHDPNLWPDPEKFDPDRFSVENKSNIKTGSFLAFGLGPRNCVGMRFAQLEMKIALIKIIKVFKVQTCSKTEVPLPLKCPTLVILPKNGIYIKLVLRDEKTKI